MDLIDDIKKQGKWNHYVAYSSIVSFFSLFLPWASAGFISASGWQKEGYIFLIPIFYNLTFIRHKINSKLLPYVVNFLTLSSIWSYIIDASIILFGNKVNLAGEGAYLALFSFAANLFFIYKMSTNKKK